MMLKLYKRDGAVTSYWEAWNDGRKVVIHWGALGEEGQSRQIRLQKGDTAAGTIARESQAPLAEGHKEIPIDDHATLIVQYRTVGWGSPSDLKKRHRVEDILNECLGWTGNGHCDGGDIGSGTINAFCFVVDPHVAASTIVAALKKRRVLNGAVIAYHFGEDPETVLWPEDYQGEFSTV